MNALLLLVLPLLPASVVQAPEATSEAPTGIAWYGTWEGGLEEARISGRPILLMSAAPQCHGVPGMW